MTPDDNSEPVVEACLPSITELTKNVQNLIDKDFDENETGAKEIIIIEEEQELPPPPTPSTLFELNRTLQCAEDDPHIIAAPPHIIAAPPQIFETGPLCVIDTSNEDHDVNNVVTNKGEVFSKNSSNHIFAFFSNFFEIFGDF